MTEPPPEAPQGTDCTPHHCSYGVGHACDAVTRYPEAFPPGGGWQYAWRRSSWDWYL